ncbi:GNAT family N-acetyltransferase [Streptomyces sp. NPDC047082]|uniref:GNAT family N-acetyltransferase n=1 Tax=Streptomyces sp. NPDC047082 TaxID=3155259 RepID=UPI0033CE4F72
MTRTITPAQTRSASTGVAPLQRADHADYLALLDLTTSSEGLPGEVGKVLTLPPVRAPFTHGPALCLAAGTRRSPQPVGALFAARPDWAVDHPLCQNDPQLSQLLDRTALCVYGVAVTPRRRRQGIARALLTQAEDRARSTGYRLVTLIHIPELAPFYQRLGFTTATHITLVLPNSLMGLVQPRPFMTAVKPLDSSVVVRTLPGARGPVLTGLLPGCDLPPNARFHNGRLTA